MGFFITFEGPDGSGKSTASTGVYEKLLENGYDAIYTREPGGIDISEQIRKVILDPKNISMDAKTEALLYAASRRQHLVEKIIPALNEGKIVICDRFIDSSLAYQGYARGLGIEEVYKINKFAIGDYLPMKTLFLNVDAKTGLDRISNRKNKDRLDQEELSFHNDVFDGYQKVIEMYKDRMIIIDATKSEEEVIDMCYQEVIKIVNG
ncbi:MAG TPA: dTMP kinase [Erysipelotrichaceae bacterium]|nr:dTMP kinase [Erysipelotrichaceae bacterium]HCY06079.1 dTMP kinase [Erysipelotrichaceae bacterium]